MPHPSLALWILARLVDFLWLYGWIVVIAVVMSWLIAFGVDGRSADFDARRLISGALGRELPVEENNGAVVIDEHRPGELIEFLPMSVRAGSFEP